MYLTINENKKKSSRFSRWIENLAVDFPHILMLLVFMSVTIRIGQNFQNVESLESYIFAEKALFVQGYLCFFMLQTVLK